MCTRNARIAFGNIRRYHVGFEHVPTIYSPGGRQTASLISQDARRNLVEVEKFKNE